MSKLSPEQIKDLEERLKSFYQHGIVPADRVLTYINPIPSSEQKLSPYVCLNVVDLDSAPFAEKIYDLLERHDTHGLINMAVERHYLRECTNQQELAKEVTERLWCSLLFILKPPNKPGFVRHLDYDSPRPGIFELRTEQTFRRESMLAIIVPAPLQSTVAKIFPDLPIVPAPLLAGQIRLSPFTLSSAIHCKGVTAKSWLDNIIMPDYKSALQKFVAESKQRKFATHITRFSTLCDLQNILTKKMTLEDSLQRNEDIMKLLTQHSQMLGSLCEFKADAYGRYAIPVEKLSLAQFYGATEVKGLATPPKFIVVNIQAAHLKSKEHGGIREDLNLLRCGYKKLRADQILYLIDHPLIALEEGLNSSGMKTNILTFPAEIKPWVAEVCEGTNFPKRMQAARTMQTFFKKNSKLKKLELLNKFKKDIHYYTEQENFPAVTLLAKRAVKVKQNLTYYEPTVKTEFKAK